MPAALADGETFESIGGTANEDALLDNWSTVTTTGPVEAPLGTVRAMLLALQKVGVAAMPLNVTVLAP
jgi:hypothetical protein